MDVGAHNGFMNNVFMNPQQVTSFIPNACRRCHHGGCDVKVMDCGCLFHAVSQQSQKSKCVCSALRNLERRYRENIVDDGINQSITIGRILK